MSRRSYRSYIILAAAILSLLSLPVGAVDGIRGTGFAGMRPFYALSTSLASWLSRPYQALFPRKIRNSHGQLCDAYDEALRLQLENLELRNELALLRGLEQQVQLWENWAEQKQQQAIAAKVIFRDPNSWMNTLWINVGEKDNKDLATPVICLHSPVVLGQSLVGMVDYVGKRQSRVRLITGPTLSPSVRVYRDHQVSHPYLAKGEIVGVSESLWRAPGSRLKGLGFNYDNADQEGDARDLRTGQALGSAEINELRILEPGDLLVTTGMDGIFPPNLHVAKVVTVSPLREGSYSYELEAEPTAGDLLSLSLVFVLSPSDYQKR